MGVIEGKHEVELCFGPIGIAVDKICKRIRGPVAVMDSVVDADDDGGFRVGFGLETETVSATQVLVLERFVDDETKAVVAQGVANADMVYLRRAAVCHDVQVEPRQIPFLKVLEVVGVHLCPCRKESGQSNPKENNPDAKLHLGLFFGKNSDFVAILSSHCGKSVQSYYINKVCRKQARFRAQSFV